MGANEDPSANTAAPDVTVVQPNITTIVGGAFEKDGRNSKLPPFAGTDVQKETWFITRWRPAASWLYLFICLWDFVLAPISLAAYSAYLHVPYIAWVPLTLGGGAIFHLSFGAIVGIYAYSRTKEKLAEIEEK